MQRGEEATQGIRQQSAWTDQIELQTQARHLHWRSQRPTSRKPKTQVTFGKCVSGRSEEK